MILDASQARLAGSLSGLEQAIQAATASKRRAYSSQTSSTTARIITSIIHILALWLLNISHRWLALWWVALVIALWRIALLWLVVVVLVAAAWWVVGLLWCWWVAWLAAVGGWWSVLVTHFEVKCC